MSMSVKTILMSLRASSKAMASSAFDASIASYPAELDQPHGMQPHQWLVLNDKYQ